MSVTGSPRVCVTPAGSRRDPVATPATLVTPATLALATPAVTPVTLAAKTPVNHVARTLLASTTPVIPATTAVRTSRPETTCVTASRRRWLQENRAIDPRNRIPAPNRTLALPELRLRIPADASCSPSPAGTWRRPCVRPGTRLVLFRRLIRNRLKKKTVRNLKMNPERKMMMTTAGTETAICTNQNFRDQM